MEITRKIAEYVVNTNLEDFPPEAVQAARAAIIDCLACMLAGSREPIAEVLSRFVQDNGGRPVASAVGRGFKTSSPDAAMLNGAMAHALDYDDITEGIKGHPSVVLIPAVLALAEEEGATGREALLAYMVGFEAACNVGEAMSVAYADDLGWHPTGPLGAIGAAAAAARVLKLDQEQTMMAISLAASQSAGLRQNFGTMTKPFHPGAACRTGVTSARLVQGGFTASHDALEGRFGFVHAFSGGEGYNLEQALQNLGRKCYLMESGIEIKKYPCCGSAHLALDATFDLLRREQIAADQVDRIEVKVDFDPPRSLIHPRPKSALEGKFSLQYCLAAAILDGKVGLQSFTDEQVLRPEAQSLIPRVDMHRIPGHEGEPSWAEAYNEVEVYLKDGRELREKAERAKSGALRGVTVDDIAVKFKDCASLVISDSAADDLLSRLNRLEDLPDLTSVMDLLRAE